MNAHFNERQTTRHLKRSGCLVAPKDNCQGIKGIDNYPVFISGWFDGSRSFNCRVIIFDSGETALKEGFPP